LDVPTLAIAMQFSGQAGLPSVPHPIGHTNPEHPLGQHVPGATVHPAGDVSVVVPHVQKAVHELLAAQLTAHGCGFTSPTTSTYLL
jgi:hypothetical protein